MAGCGRCGPRTAVHSRREYAPNGFVLTAADGSVSRFATRLQADAENARTGSKGTVSAADTPE